MMAELAKQGSVFLGTTQTNMSSTDIKGWVTSRNLILNSNQLTRSGLSSIRITCLAQAPDSGETRAKDSVQVNIFSKCLKKIFNYKGVTEGSGEKHRRYVGFRYIIRVFLMVFYGMLTYLRLGTLWSF